MYESTNFSPGFIISQNWNFAWGFFNLLNEAGEKTLQQLQNRYNKLKQKVCTKVEKDQELNGCEQKIYTLIKLNKSAVKVGWKNYIPGTVEFKDNNLYNQIIQRTEHIALLHGYSKIETPTMIIKVLQEQLIITREKNYELKKFSPEDYEMRNDLTITLMLEMMSNQIKSMKTFETGHIYNVEKNKIGQFKKLEVNLLHETPSIFEVSQIIQMAYDMIVALQIQEFTIKIGHKNLLEHLIKKITFENVDLLRIYAIMEKLKNESISMLKEQLLEETELNEEQVNLISKFLQIEGSLDLTETIKEHTTLFNDTELKMVTELKLLDIYIKSSGLDMTKVCLDLKVRRPNFMFYTDLVFEVSIFGDENEVTLAGGRFSNNILSSTQKLEGVGFALNVTTATQQMSDRQMGLRPKNIFHKVYIAGTQSVLSRCLTISSKLYEKNIQAILPDPSIEIEDQIKYCEKNNIKLAIIVIEDDLDNLKLRNIKGKTENVLTFRETFLGIQHFIEED